MVMIKMPRIVRLKGIASKLKRCDSKHKKTTVPLRSNEIEVDDHEFYFLTNMTKEEGIYLQKEVLNRCANCVVDELIFRRRKRNTEQI
jgi:hypothetical protein